MARRTKEEAAQTRESILLAALDLFSERGYSRTTFSEIGNRIGMTRGAVYWHFENKTDLLAALLDFAYEREYSIVSREISGIETIADLRNAFIQHARVVEHDPVFRKFQFFLTFQMEWSEPLLREIQEKVTELRPDPIEDFRAHFDKPEIARCLRSGTDADQLALRLGAFWVGACKLYFGREFPGIQFGTVTEDELRILEAINLEKTIVDGFDVIMNHALKEEYRYA